MMRWPGDGCWPYDIAMGLTGTLGKGDWICRRLNWTGGAGNWRDLRSYRPERHGDAGPGWWQRAGHGSWTNGAAFVTNYLRS